MNEPQSQKTEDSKGRIQEQREFMKAWDKVELEDP